MHFVQCTPCNARCGDAQVSAAWLLLLGASTGQLLPGLYERVEASYAARGISFSQFLVDEGEEQARLLEAQEGGA